MPKLKIIKGHGNHNNFIIALKQDIPYNTKLNKEFIKKICLQDDLVDGFIILDHKNFLVDYYNNDGTWETLCVNSLRCVGLILQNIYNIQNFSVTCGDGRHNIIIINDTIEITMPTPIYKTNKLTIDNISGYYIDSGAKHFVINYNKNFPDNSIVCAHWGGGLPFYSLMPEVSKSLKNVYFDTAASPLLYSEKIFEICNSLVTYEHILFGSDWPLLNPNKLIKELDNSNLNKSQKTKILFENANTLISPKNLLSKRA